MKKWFSIIGSILLIVLICMGVVTLRGHGQRNYNTCLRLGRYNVIDHKYSGALNYFQGARKVNPESSSVNHDLDQTQSYVNGISYFNRHQLARAAKEYRRSIKIGALSALNRRSKVKYQLISRVRKNTHRFILLYDQALVLNHRRSFKASKGRLQQITSNPQINLKYFKNFKVRVDQLLKADHKDYRSNQINSGINPSRQKDSFKLKSPRVVTSHPSKVTVSRARREIKRAGVNVREMSNEDVTNLIRQARKHHDSVFKYAKANY